jgi:F-type H+-transporting ATPase subunit a
MLHFLQYINYYIASAESATHSGAAEHGEKESIGNIVIHHLGDNYPDFAPIQYLNEHFLNNKLFGIFDMRITKLVLMMWIAALITILIFIPVARSLKKNNVSKSKWINLWESLVSFVHDFIVEPNFHHQTIKKAMPYFCSLFFFILFCNILGLIPSMKTATGNLAVTAGLASLTLFGIVGVGVVKHGPFGYLKSLVPHGVPIFVAPIILVIEIFSVIIKPFALTIRLFANMLSGHVVVIIFLYLVMMFQSYWVGIGSVLGALMINFLELLVIFMQAFIFSYLSAMFIGSSLQSH